MNTVKTPKQMGRDGWFTLILSTAVIFAFAGVSLMWMGRTVLRHARTSSPLCESGNQLTLVLGVRLDEESPNHDFRLRLERARLIHQQVGGQVLLMGGVTGRATLSEAQAGQQYLVAKGVAPSVLHLEDRSRNTLENLRNVREKITSENITRYTLISNRYHLARCQALANGMGMHPKLCAAEEHFRAPISSWPRLLLEAYYLHWYHTGKLWSRLTVNRHSLARIS